MSQSVSPGRTVCDSGTLAWALATEAVPITSAPASVPARAANRGRGGRKRTGTDIRGVRGIGISTDVGEHWMFDQNAGTASRDCGGPEGAKSTPPIPHRGHLTQADIG